MATFSDVRAMSGLRATGTGTYPTGSGSLSLGVETTTTRLTDANVLYVVQALVVGSTSDLVLDLASGMKTGSTTWVGGTAQVERATAAGTITQAGDATVVVTADGMTGSPKTFSVPVLLNDSAATWAGKVRTALTADAAVSALFTVGGSTTTIQLTRKSTGSYTINGTTITTYAANDATLNISLDNGTCTGITTAASSANTTAGVLTAGAYVIGDGVDFEGGTLTAIANARSFYIKNEDTSPDGITISTTSTLADFPLPLGGILQVTYTSETDTPPTITIEPVSDAIVTVIATGQSA